MTDDVRLDEALKYAVALASSDMTFLSLNEQRIIALADALRSAREGGARLPAIREAAVATDALLCRIAKSFEEIGERETAQSLRQAGLAMTVATTETPATRGREIADGTEVTNATK